MIEGILVYSMSYLKVGDTFYQKKKEKKIHISIIELFEYCGIREICLLFFHPWLLLLPL